MTVLVLARHGESTWGRRGLFTGWSDPPLSAAGERQARAAGTTLTARAGDIDRVYTSVLARATRTAALLAGADGRESVIETDWRLNERHLGMLEGLSKADVVATWGNAARRAWRDDAEARPPCLDPDSPRHPRHDPRYRHVPAARLTGGERGVEMAMRVLEIWHERVFPDLLAGATVMVVAHLGPLRVIAGHLGHRAGGERAHWPNAAPLVLPLPGRACCALAPRGG